MTSLKTEALFIHRTGQWKQKFLASTHYSLVPPWSSLSLASADTIKQRVARGIFGEPWEGAESKLGPRRVLQRDCLPVRPPPYFAGGVPVLCFKSYFINTLLNHHHWWLHTNYSWVYPAGEPRELQYYWENEQREATQIQKEHNLKTLDTRQGWERKYRNT